MNEKLKWANENNFTFFNLLKKEKKEKDFYFFYYFIILLFYYNLINSPFESKYGFAKTTSAAILSVTFS